MAEAKETAIFEVDVTSYVESLAKINKELQTQKDLQKQLSDEAKKGNEESAKQAEKVAANIKVLQQEYRTAQAAVVGFEAAQKKNVDTQNFANNSIAANRALLKQLTAQYIEIKNPSAAFTNQIKTLSDTLKKQEGAIGDARRNVGNYTDGFKEAFNSIGQAVGGAFGQVTSATERVKIGFKLAGESVSGIKAAFNDARQAQQEYTAAVKVYQEAQAAADLATQNLNAAQDTATKIGFQYAQGTATLTDVQKAQGAVTIAATAETEALAAAQIANAEATGIATVATKVFRSALISTGIGAIVVAVGLLIDYFSKFDPIIDKIEQKMAAFGAAIRVVEQALAGLFSGDTSGFDNLGGKIANAASEAEKLKQAQQDLADANSIQDVSNAKASQQYSELIVKSKNRTLTEKERLSFLQQAQVIEEENFKQRQKLSDEQSAQAIEATRLAGALNAQEVKTLQQKGLAYAYELLNLGKITSKEVELIKKAEIDKIAIQQESTNRLEKNQNAQDKLADDAAKAAEKRQQERDKELAKIKAYNDQLSKLEDETLLSDRERLIKSFDDKLELITGQSVREVELRKALEQKKLDALIEFDKKAQQAEIDRIKEREQKRVETLSNSLNEQLALNDKQLQNELALVDLSVGLEEDKAKRKLEIQLEYLQKSLEITKQLADADGVLTETELANLDSLEIAIESLQQKIAQPIEEGTNATLGKSLGLTQEDIDSAQSSIELLGEGVKGIQSIANAAYEVRINEINDQRNAEIQAIEDSTLSEEEKADKIAAINKKFNQQQYEAEKEAFETNKALNIVNTIISTAAAIVAQLANPTPYVGIALAAVAAATGAAQIAVIASQQPPPPPKFATGVIGLDGAGTETSDSIPAYLSKGESVITAKATRRYHRELAQMELSVGNNPNYQYGKGKFASGVINIPTNDAGFTTNQLNDNVAQVQLLESINSGLRNMPQPVVSVQEIERVNNARNQSIAVSEL